MLPKMECNCFYSLLSYANDIEISVFRKMRKRRLDEQNEYMFCIYSRRSHTQQAFDDDDDDVVKIYVHIFLYCTAEIKMEKYAHVVTRENRM